MKTRVLVVDDSSTQRLAWVMEFTKCGNVVPTTAKDGLDALEKIKAEPPDVIVTDLDMPNMDGETLVREVKKLHPKIFIVVVSSTVKVDFRERMHGFHNVYVFDKADRKEAIHSTFVRIGLNCDVRAACKRLLCRAGAPTAASVAA